MRLSNGKRGLNGGAKRLGLNEPLNDAKQQTRKRRQGKALREFLGLNSPAFSLGGVFRPLNTKRLNGSGVLSEIRALRERGVVGYEAKTDMR